jgi:ribose transport system substrate-binding protein
MVAWTGFGSLSIAQDAAELMPAGQIEPNADAMTAAEKFRKDPPWTIGMSFAGVGNTWIVQMIQEAKFAAAQDPRIENFVFTEANWQPAKQVADMEDLIAQGVDALIVGPIAPALVKIQVDAAITAGIPVVTFGDSDGALASTVEITGGGELFGQAGGEYLKAKLGGKGNIWVFRGIAGVGEETLRYDGLRKAIDDSELKITAEVFGDWSYSKGKQLCENLVLSGVPVDGIWFSGAEMTRACIDVFIDIGKPLVPMTGEANNGFLRVWHDVEIDAVAPVFAPGLGAAVVKAAVATLEGIPLHQSYYSAPESITNENLDQYFRPDLNDAFWVPSTLPESVILNSFGR